MESVEDKIERTVREAGPGSVWFPADFFDCGSPKAVSKALQRLVQADVLMRMERGIYCYPEESRWGMGKLPASSEAVIQAIAKRDCFRLAPSFGQAQNALGLSEQVSMNPVYTTDGPSRVIPYHKGCRPIVLHHVSPRVFSYRSRIVMLTVIALTDIGKDNLWEFELDTMKDIYSRIPYEEIRDDLRITPTWIRNVIMQMYDN